MEKVLVIIGIFMVFGILWSLPLYLVVNFVCWVFHIGFHLSLLQSFALCLFATVIHDLLFETKGGKD